VSTLLAEGQMDGFVVKYSAAGELVWAKAQVPASGHRMALTRSVGMDDAGNVYAVAVSLPARSDCPTWASPTSTMSSPTFVGSPMCAICRC
jgi:hypothetical protein